MKRISVVIAIASLFIASAAFAADKSYQVTGPVLELDANKIVVQKGKDKWELARTPDLKLSDDVKVGSKVTIAYKMTATSVEAKGGAKAANEAVGATKDAATSTAKHTAKAKAAKETTPAHAH